MRLYLSVFGKLAFGFLIFSTIEATTQPKINSFTPVKGPAGTIITISGTGFNTTAANNIVFFGAVKATVTAASATSLTVTAPSGATYQPISVLDIATHLTGYSAKPFITTFNFTGSGIPANFYRPKVDFVTGSLPRNVVISDIDADGKPELIIANGSAGTISVLKNTSASGNIGASSFAAKVDFTVGTFTEFVIPGDVNGDGKPDLAVIYNGRIAVMVNTATSGSISASSFAPLVDITPIFKGTAGVAIADLDGDGLPELIGANPTNTLSIVRNTSTSGVMSFAPLVNLAYSGTPSWVVAEDVDGDLKRDIIITNAALGANSVAVFRNTSVTGTIDGSSFASQFNFTVGPTPRSVAFGDIDGDGKPDMVTANSDPTNTTLSVLRNTSVPGVINASSFDSKVDFTTGLGPRSVIIDDVNGDGKLDVVVANANAKSISVFNNTATSGSITSSSLDGKVDFAMGNSPVSAVIGDLNGDGVAETVIATGSNDNRVSVFQMDLSTLPVTLTSLKATPQTPGVLVEWISLQESGVSGFEIERSQDGQQFTKVGNVPAKGKSSLAISYHWFDPDPYPGLNFYRLKIIELGKESYSKVIRVNITAGSERKIVIYPNPVRNKNILLQMTLPRGRYKITLTNKLGQQILRKEIEHNGGNVKQRIYLSRVLESGIYQVNITGTGINSSHQVVID